MSFPGAVLPWRPVSILLGMATAAALLLPAQEDGFETIRKQLEQREAHYHFSKASWSSVFSIMIKESVGLDLAFHRDALEITRENKRVTMNVYGVPFRELYGLMLHPRKLTLAYDGSRPVLVPRSKLGKAVVIRVRLANSVLKPDLPGERSEDASRLIRKLDADRLRSFWPRGTLQGVGEHVSRASGVVCRVDAAIRNTKVLGWASKRGDEKRSMRDLLSRALPPMYLEAVADGDSLRIVRPEISEEVEQSIRRLALGSLDSGKISARDVPTKMTLSQILKACPVSPEIRPDLLKRNDAVPENAPSAPKDASALAVLEAALAARDLVLSPVGVRLVVSRTADAPAFMTVNVVTYRDLLKKKKDP